MSVGDAPIRVFDEVKESFDGHLEIDANGAKGEQYVRESGGSGDTLADLAGPRGTRRGGLPQDAGTDSSPQGKPDLLSRTHSEAVNPDNTAWTA